MTPFRKSMAAAAMILTALANGARAADPVSLKWLETAPAVQEGISWGVPYPKGQVAKGQQFSLMAKDNKALPLQDWPLAYWPDGSIKWMGYATVAGPDTAGPLSLAPSNDQARAYVKVQETATAVDIDTGDGAAGLHCHIAKTGANLFDTLAIGERVIGSAAHLEVILQKGPEIDPAKPPARERYTSAVKKVTVEQNGPVRAVVKIEGMHKADGGAREWLPFYVRLYFYPGITPVRMMHSFVYDGTEKEDLIKGMGIAIDVTMKEEVQNRHVRFGGQEGEGGGGLWAEPIQPMTAYQGNFTSPGVNNAYAAQIAGQRVGNRAQVNAGSQDLLDHLAKWDDFRLIQPNAQGFTIEKRTSEQGSWVSAGAGTRASGLVFTGDVSGGLAVGVQNFWQTAPASLEVRHALSPTAQMHIWLWSPDAPAMDMRHYDTVAHGLNESYEDVEIPLATAQGIAHTASLTLFPSNNVPTKEVTAADAQMAQDPPLIVCTPQYLHDQHAFGYWSLQDRSTAFKKNLEDQLDAEIAFYQKAVDQYDWYGFWKFGDVMHSYDANRQTWKYDVGGFAWDNSEQGTDMVLWYSFLRTGRADIFRFAEAMSRMTGESMCYHQGPMAGLGSRHNVVPWGDGAKEARISMAPYRRFYYYLTTDERTGDVMHEMLQADSAITRIDPMRKVLPPTPADAEYPARVRAGPDWFAFAGNWMTEWERTGDTKWRDKILTSMKSIEAMPFGFSTSQDLLWGFFPETGKLVPRDLRSGGYNLVNNMGGPEVMMELNDLIDDPAWQKVWLDYCQKGNGRLAGYAYLKTGDLAMARNAVGALRGGLRTAYANEQHYAGPDVLKPIDVPRGMNGLVTNDANQPTLQIIEILELCKDQLPTDAAAPAPGGGGGGARGRGAAPGAPPGAATTAPRGE